MLNEGERWRVIQGNCLEVMKDMAAGSVDLIVTSPPYNCRKPYAGFVDAMPWGEWYEWMADALTACYRLLVIGGTLAINIPPYIGWQRDHPNANSWIDYDGTIQTHRGSEKVMGKGRIEPVGFRLYEMMRQIDVHVREPIAWVKGTEGNAISPMNRKGMDSDPYLRTAYEFILLGSKGQWFHRGGTGRRGAAALPYLDDLKDVWFMSPSSNGQHPATFPQELPLRLIRLFTHVDDATVLDCFAGSGTTGMACMKTGRRFVGIEISEDYCRIARKRIAAAAAQLALPLDMEARKMPAQREMIP